MLDLFVSPFLRSIIVMAIFMWLTSEVIAEIVKLF